jgi:hypothetical protein
LLKFRYFKYFLFSLILFSLLGKSTACFAQSYDSISNNLPQYDTTMLLKHSPRKASFYSAVFPGLGQIYNKKYWKVPILYAGIAICAYAYTFNQNEYLRFRKAYILRERNDPNSPDEFASLGDRVTLAAIGNARDFYRRDRDISIMSFAGIYLLNVIDATVDAYLFDYDISPDLALKVRPSIMQTYGLTNFGVRCSLRF